MATLTTAAPGSTGAVGTTARRLLPLLFALYTVNFIDRANISVAALTMNVDLHLSATAYGTASGVFFLGYVLFQIPACAALARFGASRTIAAVTLAWALASGATAFVTDAHTLYLARFALGMAEAGFFPGVVAYLTRWFPCAQRARALAAFLVAIPVANIIGLPVSGLIVSHVAVAGWPGWRIMFLIEAVPALLLGLLVYRLLPDSPARAPWLTDDERAELLTRLHADTMDCPRRGRSQTIRVVTVFATVYSGLYFAMYALQFFLPQLIKAIAPHTNVLTASALSAVPYALAAGAMVAWSRRTDGVGARPAHIAVPALAAAAGALVVAGAQSSTVAALAGLSLAIGGILAATPTFWSFCTAHLQGPRAAVTVAVVNATASLASFAGPWATGRLKDLTGNYLVALLVVGGALAAAAAGTGLLPGKVVRRARVGQALPVGES